MSEKPIASASRTKEILKQFNLRAKKGFGQNFLTDVSVVARCAEASHCEGAVIEIGPGIGALSEQLALRARHVTAFEIDERVIPVLAETLSSYGNVEVILQDFLECDLNEVAGRLKKEYGSVSICANLPYYITTPILFRIMESNAPIDWITVMVQKEVADRFVAEPGSAAYSALSVECQYLYDVKRLFTVSRTSFNPVPNVDSAIVQFHRLEKDPEVDQNGFFTFVKGCFAQRRKTIYNNLREITGDSDRTRQILKAAGIPENVRAQSLKPEELVRLYRETIRL